MPICLQRTHVVFEVDPWIAVRSRFVVDGANKFFDRVLVSRVGESARHLNVGGDDLDKVLVVHKV